MLNIFRKKHKVIDKDDCFDQVCEALKEIMPEELNSMELKRNTKLEVLGIDSIKYINLFISLEEIIGKDLEDIVDSVNLSDIKTINDINELVLTLRKD